MNLGMQYKSCLLYTSYAIYDGRLYKDENFSIDRRFPMRHAKTNRYKFKAFIFALSPQFACWLRKYK